MTTGHVKIARGGTLPESRPIQVARLRLPAGNYVVSAKAHLFMPTQRNTDENSSSEAWFLLTLSIGNQIDAVGGHLFASLNYSGGRIDMGPYFAPSAMNYPAGVMGRPDQENVALALGISLPRSDVVVLNGLGTTADVIQVSDIVITAIGVDRLVFGDTWGGIRERLGEIGTLMPVPFRTASNKMLKKLQLRATQFNKARR